MIMSNIPALPPVPSPQSQVYLCFTKEVPGGWELLNSLFDLYDAPSVWLHFQGIQTRCGPVSVLQPRQAWGDFVRNVFSVPDIRQALADNLVWYVFGKNNLIDPMFCWAAHNGLCGRKPGTSDFFDRFPGMYPTAENRNSFDKPFCEWLIGRQLDSPLELLNSTPL